MSIGYHQQRKWWGGRIATLFGRTGFIRLASATNKPLLSTDDESGAYLDLQFDKDYSGDLEDIRKRNSELEEKLDELRRTVDEFLKTKNEARDKIESLEKMERTTATLSIEIRRNTDRIAALEGKFVNKMENMEKISETEKRNDALEEQIKRLKDRLIYLEVNSIQQTPVESTSSAPQTDLDQIEEMDSLPYIDELYKWIIVLIFCVGYLIGMHI